MRVSVFQKIDKTGSPLKNQEGQFVSYTIDNTLNIIKNHPKKELIERARQEGKGNPDKKYVDTVWEYYTSQKKREETGKSGEFKKVKRNFYDHIKSTQIQCVTWTSTYNGRRSKANLDTLSGYIYIDIDDFSDTPIERVWKILTDDGLSFVKAVWRSFGGNGIGCLVKADNLTVDNYKSTWNALNKLFKDRFSFKLDAQTKDITRINVLSYDPDIFIREDSDVIPFIAVEPKKKRELKVVDYDLSESTQNQILFDIFQIFYHKDENWNRQEDRLVYGFYQKYFSFTNRYGVKSDAALAYLVQMKDKYDYLFKYREFEEIEYICNKQYNAYSDQHGRVEVEIVDDLPLEDQYVITAFYQEYKGDVELKLQSIFTNLSYKRYDIDKLMFIFSIITKENGIFKKDVIPFLEGELDKELNIEFVVNSVYNNPKYKFGIVKEFTTEAIAEKRRLFILKEENKGNRIIDNSETKKPDVKKILQKSLTDCFTTFGKMNDGNATKFSKRFFMNTLSYAIDKDVAFQYFYDKLQYGKRARYGSFYSEDIYSYFGFRFGLRAVNEETHKTLAERFDISKTYTLPNDKKLSHLNLQFEDNTIIWANTNMGKTTYICNDLNEKRLILVPVIGALENIEERFASSVFYGDKKNVQDGDDLIVCTYSSFHALVRRMSTWETPISEYSLYIDEMHNFAVSSEKSFRNKELNYILDNMHMFNKRVMLTGTLFPILHPKLMEFKVWRVNWESTPMKKYNIVHYEDIYGAISSRMIRGKKNIIYLQNKQEEGEMGKLMDYLRMKGWENIQCINADEKYSAHFKKLVTEEYIEDHVEVLICTSIMVEALNILNEDIGTLHFMSYENPILLEQMANRTRKVLPETIYLYKKIKKATFIEDDGDINVIEVQNDLIRESEYLLSYFSRPVNLVSESYSKIIAEKIKRDQLFEKNSLVRIKEHEYTVDYLSISNLALKAETGHSYKEETYMDKILHEYNWKIGEVEYDSDAMLEQDKVTLNELKEEKNEELTADLKEILEEIQQEGEEVVKERIQDSKIKSLEKLKRPRHQIMLRQKIAFLCHFMEFLDAFNLLETWVFEHDMSSRIWSKTIRQINFKLGKMKGVFKETADNVNEFEEKLLDYYHSRKSKDKKAGEYLFTKKQLIALINRYKHLHPIFANKDDYFTEDNILNFIKKYFELIPKLDSRNKIKYVFGGLNYNLDLTIQTTRIYEFAEQAMQDKKEFTTDQLHKIVFGFRKDLPFYRKIRITPKNAMLLLSDCVTLEPVAMRTVYGKRVRTYGITSLFGKYIQDVTLIPQRTTKISDKHSDDLTTEEKILLKTVNADSDKYFVKAEEEGTPLPF
jgi:hypothetical protein